MKRFLITLYAVLAWIMSVQAQARFTSHTETLNFGQIEWKQPVTATYTVTNTGNEPLVIQDVEPDCACNQAQWTKTPIVPGDKGEVSITFDAKALGHFRKSVAIRCNAEPHLLYLYLTGEVVTEVKDYGKTHPYLIGDIRLSLNEIEFPDVQRGERPQISIGVVNLSDHAYAPLLMHLPPYLELESQPTVLQKSEKGRMILTLCSDRLTDLGLTQTSVYLSRFRGDKVGEENELSISAILLPDFSALTERERNEAPQISLSTTELDFSALLARKNKAKGDITLTNTGRSPLQVNKLQVFHPAVGVSLKKSLLQPGESTRLRVTVDKRNISKRRQRLRLLMITNAPAQPKVEINIKDK